MRSDEDKIVVHDLAIAPRRRVLHHHRGFRLWRVADDDVGLFPLQHFQRAATADEDRANLHAAVTLPGRYEHVEQTGIAHARGRREHEIRR